MPYTVNGQLVYRFLNSIAMPTDGVLSYGHTTCGGGHAVCEPARPAEPD